MSAMRALALAALLAGLGLLLATATGGGRLAPASLPSELRPAMLQALAERQLPLPPVPPNRIVGSYGCDMLIPGSKGRLYAYSYTWQRLRKMHFRITLPDGRSVAVPCPPRP